MNKGRTALLCALALLAACHGDATEAPQVTLSPRIKAPPAAKPGSTPAELTVGMVEAVTIGISTVPVAVKFDIPERPVVGQPAEVIIAVMPQISADHAILTVTGSNQLPLPNGAGGPIEMSSVEPTQVYRHNVKVTPTAEGVQLLGLGVSLQHDDITETRIFSVPVIVAAGTDGSAGAKR